MASTVACTLRLSTTAVRNSSGVELPSQPRLSNPTAAKRIAAVRVRNRLVVERTIDPEALRNVGTDVADVVRRDDVVADPLADARDRVAEADVARVSDVERLVGVRL